MKHIRTIIDKEWAEIFKNRMVIFTVVLMPLLFTALPLIMLSAMGPSLAGSSDMADVPELFGTTCANLTATDCMQTYILTQFLIMFMMMPLIIPITIAAYSIVGEKTTRSLEPLLASPIRTEELLAGKALAAALPAVAATFLSYLIFFLLIPVTGASAAIRQYVVSGPWLIGILVIGPLMAIAAVNFAVMVSSRVNDPRVAEQLSAVLIVPVLGLMFGQLAGVLVINTSLMLISALALALVDLGLVYMGARLFQRETILTRWK